MQWPWTFSQAPLDFGQNSSPEHLDYMVLDFMYLGRWPSLEELRRSPSAEQRAVFARLRTMIAVCGDAREPVSMCPGRTGPELGSQLFQLERFCDVCPDFVSGYMQGFKQPFVADPGLLSVHEHPELMPYRSLDVSRLKLVGEGKWPMESFLNGPLWLPFKNLLFSAMTWRFLLVLSLTLLPKSLPNV